MIFNIDPLTHKFARSPSSNVSVLPDTYHQPAILDVESNSISVVINQDGHLLTDSRNVAKMVDKEHKNLVRDIRGYIQYLEKFNELNLEPVDFFIENFYKDSKGEARPCYLITKKVCEVIGNKLTGKKETLFTVAYVTQFNERNVQSAEIKGLQHNHLVYAHILYKAK